MTPSPLGAILLSGGRASRLGGAAKPQLTVGTETLLDATLAALDGAGADPIIAVGPASDTAHRHVRWVREDPPFGGPVAAIITALPLIPHDRVLVVATDLPLIRDAVQLLQTTAETAGLADGLCLMDPSGRPQWLTALYRTAALREAAARIPDGGRDASVRTFVAGLEIGTVRAPDDLTDDVDTWEDLERARRRADGTEAKRKAREAR